MNLRDAMLCLDCDEIGLKAAHCMLCGSGAVVDLSKWILPMNKTEMRVAMKRESLMDEVNEMRERINCMMTDIGDEPLGCGA